MKNRIKNAIQKNDELDLSFKLIKLCSVETGLCKEDCVFCGQSSRTDPKYKIIKKFSSFTDLSNAVDDAIKNEAKEILFSASQTRRSNKNALRTIASAVKLARNRGLDVCIDFGLMMLDDLKYLFDAGANIYINSVQTAKSFFPKVCSTQKYEDKIKILEVAKNIGYSNRSGGILGLGETEEQRYEFASQLQSLPCDTVSLCLFQPIKGSVMESHPKLSSSSALDALALMRLNIEKPLYLLGGREKVISPEYIKIALKIVNGTTAGDYLFTKGESIEKLHRFIPRKGKPK